MIKNEVLLPGSKLMSERELCDLFNVSRTSVREAIRGLSSIGVLEKRRNGTYVREQQTDIVVAPMSMLLQERKLSIDDLFEARIATESQIARIAAGKATAADIALLDEYASNAEVPGMADRAILSQAALFHRQIAKTTGNQILIDMYTVIYSALQSMRAIEPSLRPVAQSNVDHRQILECIKNHDQDGAERKMREHLNTLKTSVKK